MKVFNVGSINIDNVFRVPHLVKPGETLLSHSLETVLGGKGANQSLALARAGIDVRHVGRLGKEAMWAAEQMREAGVDIGSVQLIDGPSGLAIIQVDDNGENSIILHGGANQSFSRPFLTDALASAESGDWLLIQNECNELAACFAIAQEKNLSIAFNPAPMTAAVSKLPIELCKLLIVNETEAAELSGSEDPEAALATLGERCPNTRLVLTLGARGARLQHGTQQWQRSAEAVDVVDTTGAGDTFVGYFLAGLIQGLDDATALHRACRAAALAVTVAGAAPSIPSIGDLVL